MSFSSKNAKPCSPSSMSAPPCRVGTAAIGRRERTIARCASCSRCTIRPFNSWRISALPPSRSTISRACGLGIGGGAGGGTSGAYVEQIFKVLGIPALVQHDAWDNLGQQLAEQELDGAAAAIGAPFPALARLEQTVDFIAPSPEQIAGIR